MLQIPLYTSLNSATPHPVQPRFSDTVSIQSSLFTTFMTVFFSWRRHILIVFSPVEIPASHVIIMFCCPCDASSRCMSALRPLYQSGRPPTSCLHPSSCIPHSSHNEMRELAPKGLCHPDQHCIHGWRVEQEKKHVSTESTIPQSASKRERTGSRLHLLAHTVLAGAPRAWLLAAPSFDHLSICQPNICPIPYHPWAIRATQWAGRDRPLAHT